MSMRARRAAHFCGPHLCAMAAALLLLLSVSVLYSRLSSSRLNSHLSLHSPSPPLPSDPDLFSDESYAGDDRIDELDNLDEETDLNSTATPNTTTTKPSGLFWDHAVGVLRRSFDHRSGYLSDPWPDPDPDPTAAAFTSDDLPLNDPVEQKLGHVRAVEDALLIRKTPSSLRDGWAPWFEKKLEFLKKDRMFRSNLDGLNPLNNELLQDPDMPGVTTLTRGDKLFQKMVSREIQTTPFGRKTLDHAFDRGSSKNSGSSDAFLDTLGSRNYLGSKREKSSLRRLSSAELEEGVYTDGKRWGYFPGLPPHLSFGKFMYQFFVRGNCSMRVFMVWNSPPWSFGVRHQRSLESVLYHHRDACVVVFSETIDLNFFSDFVKDGFKVAVVMPNLDELLKNTPTHAFASVWHEWRKTQHYSIHYSELIRIAALYKYGGVYLDFDVIVLKPLHSLRNVIAKEGQLPGSFTFNGAVMAFRRHSPFILECLHEFQSTYDDTLLRWNGADLLTRVVERIIPRYKDSLGPLDLNINSSTFFPITYGNIIRYLTNGADEAEKSQADLLFRKILNQSYTFHFWNSLTSAFVPEPNSLVERLLNHYCLRCLEVL